MSACSTVNLCMCVMLCVTDPCHRKPHTIYIRTITHYFTGLCNCMRFECVFSAECLSMRQVNLQCGKLVYIYLQHFRPQGAGTCSRWRPHQLHRYLLTLHFWHYKDQTFGQVDRFFLPRLAYYSSNTIRVCVASCFVCYDPQISIVLHKL